MLERGLKEYETEDTDKAAITKILLDCFDRKRRADEGKSEYIPNPKENTQQVREKYIAFMSTLGITVEVPSTSFKSSVPKPIPADSYPDIEEIRKDEFGSFVAFAIETTGINPKMDCIIQIGAIKVINGQIVDSKEFVFDELVKPYKRNIPEKITELTGIKNSDVQTAREMWEVFPDFIRFSEGLPLVGYNSVDFASKFLIRAGRYSNLIIENKLFDVMRYLTSFKEELGVNKARVKLSELAEVLGIASNNSHNALEDAEVVAKVFMTLKRKAMKKGMSTEEIKVKCQKEIETLTASISSKSKEVMSYKQRLSELSTQASLHETTLGKLQEQLQAEEKEKAELSAAVSALKESIARDESRVSSMQVELSGLSFMAFGKKKELKTQIEATQKALSESKASLGAKEDRLAALLRANTTEELKAEEALIADINDQISKQKVEIERIEKLLVDEQAKLDQVETDLSEVEAVLEAEAKAEAEAEAEAKAKLEAEMRAKIEAEMRAQFEAEAKAKEEEAARLRAEAEAKAKAEAEMCAKIEAEMRAKLEAEAAQQVASSMTTYTRPYIADEKLAKVIGRAIDKLEAYFPEHKIFALDSIDSGLRENLAGLYKRAGYATVDDMFTAYGFEVISGDAVKELRSFVMYTPGNEPECIKPRVVSMLNRLNEYYPDHVISRGMQTDHKKLSQSISGLYQWLGYEDAGAMLAAYGYEYNVAASGSGRPVQDFQPMIDALLEKYKDGPKPKSMGELLFDNPDLKGPLKTLQNKSNELFGMTLKKYFEEIGIFAAKGTAGARTPRSVSAGTQDAVLEALTSLYEGLDESEYGTVDDAMECLEGMNVKQNKSGQVYIFRAVGCDSTVTIPYGIDFISNGAFSGQRDLREVIISAAITELPVEAFADCPSLENISIPEGVIAIGEKAFANCTALKSITLPESLQQIAAKAFEGCTSLEEVEFLNPMTMVSDDAFSGSAYTYEPPKEAEATDSKFFKYSMDRKGNVTISGFTGDMETIVIPGMIEGHPVTTIGKGAFQGCKHLVDVSMSDYITTMQGDSFRDCISLKRIHLSNGISKIITTSFNGCIGLEEINIPDGVTEIKRATFKESPIKKLHIGKSLSAIESKPFYNGEYDPYTGRQKTTRAINAITVDPANPNLRVDGSMILSKDGKILFAVLGNKKNVSIPEGVEVINAFAFEGLVFLSDVALPDSLVEIGEKAFASTALRSVTFGSGVRKIGSQAFEYCQNLTAAVFNEGLEEIGERAFMSSPVVSVLLPASLRVLGENAFNALAGGYYGGNERIQEFEIAAENPTMKADGQALYVIADGRKTLQALYGQRFRQYIFDSRQASNEYTVQEGTTHIGNAAFGRCQSLSKVNLPDSLISIGENAFVDCQYLKELSLPNGIEVIGANAFSGTALKEFTLGPAVREIGTGAFITGSEWNEKRTKLRKIKVDQNNETFYVENKLLLKKKADGSSAVVVYFGGDEVVALPDGVSEIYNGAFMRSIVQEIQIPSTVTAIGERAFQGCSMLVRLRVGFAEPENGANFAVIYIPEIKHSEYEYQDNQIRDQYMDCIRVDGSGTIFDFVKYDSLFETINTAKDKILVATDRLKSAIQLVPLYRDKYLGYLRKNAKKAVEIVVQFDDLSGLNTLAELEVFTGENIDQVIELANKAKKAEILSYLMNYKNSKIGITEEDYDL